MPRKRDEDNRERSEDYDRHSGDSEPQRSSSEVIGAA
jgi:hypothetical protein